MKKWNLLSVLLLLAIAFTACDNNDEPAAGSSITSDGKISGKLQFVEWNDDGELVIDKAVNNEIDSIGVFLFNNYDTDVIFLTGDKVSNGSFSLQLPEPPTAYLYVLADEINNDIADDIANGNYIEGEIKTSNKDAKYTSIDISVYKNGKYIGSVYRFSIKEEAEADLIYVDRKVNITGTYISYYNYSGNDQYYKDEYNVYFNKGWNTKVRKFTYKNNTDIEKITANNDGNMIWAVK